MITIIFGPPGVGKSALNTYFLKQTYLEQGDLLLAQLKNKIDELNHERDIPLQIPEKPPIFADYKVSFKTGYNKFFEPYFINGYYMGLPNEILPVQNVPPFSKIFLSEAQRYYDSRKSSTFPVWVSRFYEMHRHYNIDITLDVQRPNLIDLNIKALSRRLLEVQELKHIYKNKTIVKSIFRCREFDSWASVEQYQATGSEELFKEVEFEHIGNIFDSFDSFTYFKEFLPGEKANFNYINYGASSPFMSFNEPKEFRTKPPAKKE